MPAKLIHDAKKQKKKILSSIKKYGTGPEHNYYNYLNLQEHGKRCVFADFGKGRGILAQKNPKNEWFTVDQVLAPEREKLKIFLRNF